MNQEISALLTKFLPLQAVEPLFKSCPKREVTFWTSPAGGIKARSMFPTPMTGYVISQALVAKATDGWASVPVIPNGHTLILVDRFEHHPLPPEVRPRKMLDPIFILLPDMPDRKWFLTRKAANRWWWGSQDICPFLPTPEEMTLIVSEQVAMAAIRSGDLAKVRAALRSEHPDMGGLGRPDLISKLTKKLKSLKRKGSKEPEKTVPNEPAWLT